MDKRYRNLGALLILIVLAVAVYNIMLLPQLPVVPVPQANFESEFNELGAIFASNGLEMKSSLAVDPAFYALERPGLVSLKQGLADFSSSAKTDAGQLADAFIVLADYAIKRNDFNEKAAFLQGISTEAYCTNLALFENRDLVGQQMLEGLENYQANMNMFVQGHSEELAGQGKIALIELDVSTEGSLQQGRENATALLWQACGGEI